ncbi:MAG: hypothetical protein AAGC55_16325, partial [Myxococcota bacterium]
MSSSRKKLLAKFRGATLADSREEANACLFQILYGLSAEMQIGLARDMAARFLPVFHANHPEVTWPTTVLDDLDAYFNEHEQTLPDEPEDSFGGDMSFNYALYALLRALAYSKQGLLPRVTPACCTALLMAVSARAANVWHADDPDGVQAWRDGAWETLAGRGEHNNAASMAVARREWLVVADWLEAHNVDVFPVTDEAEREKWFAWWQDRECLL